MFSGHPAALKMPPAPDVGKGPWIWVGVATNTAFAGPWGVTYAANLTPNKATGLDSWKTADFAKAICTEKTRMCVTTCCRRRHGKTIREWLTAVYARCSLTCKVYRPSAILCRSTRRLPRLIEQDEALFCSSCVKPSLLDFKPAKPLSPPMLAQLHNLHRIGSA